MRKGFTLAEFLVCLAIVMVLTAVLGPVFSRVKMESQVQSSLSRLRQLSMAVIQYRTDHDGHGRYDNMYSAGIPPFQYYIRTYFGLPHSFFRSPCGYKMDINHNLRRISYMYWPWGHSDVFNNALERHREQTIIWTDMHCNEASLNWDNPYTVKLGLGANLGGQAVRFRKRGSTWDFDWWIQNPEE